MVEVVEGLQVCDLVDVERRVVHEGGEVDVSEVVVQLRLSVHEVGRLGFGECGVELVEVGGKGLAKYAGAEEVDGFMMPELVEVDNVFSTLVIMLLLTIGRLDLEYVLTLEIFVNSFSNDYHE